MHFTCRSFIGNSEPKSWSRFWENEPDDPILKSTKGHLFALISLSSEEEKDLNSIGHDINFEFNQTYFNLENHSDIFSTLNQSINSIIKNPLYSGYKIDFVVAVVLNNQIYLTTYGDCKVVLKRQDQISILLSGDDNKINTINGPIENQDKFLLLTNTFFEKISWQKIKLFLSESDIETIEENFLSATYSLVDQQGLSAAFIEVESDEEVAAEVHNSNQDEPVKTSPLNYPKTNFNFSKINQFFKKNNSVFVSHHEIEEVGKRKKISLLLGIILIIALSFSVIAGYQKNKHQKIENQYQSLKTEIKKQIEDINTTKSLNIDQARDIATQAQTTVNQMLALKIHQDEANSFDSQLKNILSQTGSSQSFTPDLLYDTGNITGPHQFKKIIFNDGKIYLLDSQNGRIDSVDVANKSNKSVLAAEKIKSAITFAFDKSNLYLINKDNISLVEKTNLTSKFDFIDSNITPIDLKFWNGAAYVLDASNQVIWKFSPNSTGFSKPQSWLKNNLKLDSNAVSMDIDSKVWILFQNGSVIPYASGVKSDFQPKQTFQFTQADDLRVTLDKDLLAFVDNNNIIYVYQKTGELLSKYNLGNLKVTDLAFNESANSIYLLCSDQKIYSIKF